MYVCFVLGCIVLFGSEVFVCVCVLGEGCEMVGVGV